MKLIYLACPYSHKDDIVRLQRFHLVNSEAARLMRLGYAVISPISHSHPIATENDLPTDFEFWQNQDLAILKRCDMLAIYKLDGFQDSKGLMSEIKFAKENYIPIIDSELLTEEYNG